MRRRRPYRRRRYLLPLLGPVVAVILLASLLEVSLRPTIKALAQTQARWLANEAIQQAVLEKVVARVNYKDLVQLEKDNQQRIVFMQANTMRIAQMTAEASLSIQGALQKLQERRAGIPLGQALGSQFLANYGPHLRLEVVPLGVPEIKVEDSFEAAGINQTRHRIFLRVNTELQVLIPFNNTRLNVTSEVPIADAIVVGSVPGTYVLFEGVKGFAPR